VNIYENWRVFTATHNSLYSALCAFEALRGHLGHGALVQVDENWGVAEYLSAIAAEDEKLWEEGEGYMGTTAPFEDGGFLVHETCTKNTMYILDPEECTIEVHRREEAPISSRGWNEEVATILGMKPQGVRWGYHEHMDQSFELAIRELERARETHRRLALEEMPESEFREKLSPAGEAIRLLEEEKAELEAEVERLRKDLAQAEKLRPTT